MAQTKVTTTKAHELAKEQKQVSVSEFFLKNRHLLGFDNPLKALSTTVKELCDNSLDACEEMRVLPEIIVEIQQTAENKFRIIVEDNGPGIVKEQLPNVFARLLYGSKFFGNRQSRGQQGIGVSASILYGQLTTGKPARITSRIDPKHPTHYIELRINTAKNEPDIVVDKEIEWLNKQHGTRVEIELEGKYQKGKLSVDEYVKQSAISNPHAQFTYINPLKERVIYRRATDQLPKQAKKIQPHPHGVELGALMQMMKATKAKTILQFFTNEFSRVSSNVAHEILTKANIPPTIKPDAVAHEQAEKIFKAIQETKIMAPPTDCLSPIGEEILLASLKKEFPAEFYTATTRSPSVYRGIPFQVECCTGDSKIYLENGDIISIKRFVESKMLDKRVLSLNESLKIIPSKVFMVHKFKNNHKILKITTKTGRTLKLTSNNEIPIIEEGRVIWKRVEDAMVGDHVAVPRIMNIYGEIPLIINLLDPDQVKIINDELMEFVMDKIKQKYGSYKEGAKKLKINYNNLKAFKRQKAPTRPTLTIVKKIAEGLNLNFEEIKKNIKHIRILDTKCTNPHVIRLPQIDEDLLYVLGLLNSDGYISRKGILFVNKDEYLHQLYHEKVKNLFNLVTKRYKKMEAYLCNKTLYIILKKIEGLISTLPDNLIIAWLKGFVDGDGWVYLSQGRIRRIGIATAKQEKAQYTQTLLLRLGIIAKIEKKKIYNSVGKIGDREIRTKNIKYDLVINSLEHIKKFCSLISFRQTARANKLIRGIKKIMDVEERSNRDILPLGGLVRELREENNLFQHELGFSDQTIRQVEKNNQYLTRIHAQELVEYQYLSGDVLKQLKILAFSDVLWDRIINIELMPHEEYVYDLTIENGNFVANNIVMHNCAITYGGSLPKEELVRLIRFANKVPLQYQQSACAMTRSVTNTVWRNYGLEQSKGALPSGPAVIVLHIASVWVPFTSESKEAIAHYPEIIKEIKLAVQEVGRKLNLYIRKNVRAREAEERVNLFEKYIPEVADALAELSGKKKEDIKAHLEKILKKGLPQLMAQANGEEQTKEQKTNDKGKK